MTILVNAHRELDRQCCVQAEAAGLKIENLTVADIAYPLISKRVVAVFQQQLFHVHNGCMSNDRNAFSMFELGL